MSTLGIRAAPLTLPYCNRVGVVEDLHPLTRLLSLPFALLTMYKGHKVIYAVRAQGSTVWGKMFQVAANLEVIFFPQTARVVHISGFQLFLFHEPVKLNFFKKIWVVWGAGMWLCLLFFCQVGA